MSVHDAFTFETGVESAANAPCLRCFPCFKLRLTECSAAGAYECVPIFIQHWWNSDAVNIAVVGNQPIRFALTGKGQPENLSGWRMSENICSLLGINAILGRDFGLEEETYGKHDVALISHELWERRFGGDPNIVGQTMPDRDQRIPMDRWTEYFQ